jgi:hypothetical protein
MSISGHFLFLGAGLARTAGCYAGMADSHLLTRDHSLGSPSSTQEEAEAEMEANGMWVV